MKTKAISTLIIILLLLVACGENRSEKNEPVEPELQAKKEQNKTDLDFIFPKGEKGSAEYFTGTAYNYGLVSMDSTYTTLVGNVYFEPGARSNWHTHPAGQILIITDGKGFHQIEGQQIEILEKGDVAKCPPNVRHWHGASPDQGMQQLYIVPNTEKGVVEWMEPVTDDQYNRK